MRNSVQSDETDLLAALFANATEGMCVVSEQGGLQEWNPAFCRQTGYDGQSLGQLALKQLFPNEVPTANVQFKIYELRQQNGRISPISVETRPLNNGRFLLILHHPTEQTSARQKIAQLTETIQTINDLAIKLNGLLIAPNPIRQIATIIREISGVFATTVSTYQPESQDLLIREVATPPSESGILKRVNGLIGRSLVGMRIPVSPEMYQKMLREQVTAVGTLHDVTFGEIPKPISAIFHRTFQIDKLYGLALSEGEKLIGTVVIVMRRDAEPLTQEVRLMLARICAITLRRARYEQQLQASESKFRSYVEHAPLGIFVTDRNGRYLEANPTAAQMLGYTQAEIQNLTLKEIIHPDFLETSLQHLKTIRQIGQASGEYTLCTKAGQLIHTHIQAAALNEEQLIAFVQDITEQKTAEHEQALLESQLRQVQKMDSIGRLAGGIAHDFNNLLTIIQMYADLMNAQMAEADPLRPKLDQIRHASERATDLTRQLLAFSRKQIMSTVTLDLNERITQLHKMLGRLIGEDISLTMTLEPELWHIQADPGQIEQVIMNLVVNARDAMPTGGMLTIETQNVFLDESFLASQLKSPTGPAVMLAISDTGNGMDEATRQRIFEPFFTTKEPGNGTGLGLATVHGIVRQSGGSIFVYSEPDQGSTFKIYLPATDQQTNKAALAPQKLMDHSGTETILVVEDEAAVRSLVCATLEELGYTVLEAKDGYAALALMRQRTEPVDLLLTDVVMPNMSGRELAEHLTGQFGNLKVLFMSGYMDDAVVRHGILTAQVAFLPKPFSGIMLANKVRTVLDEETAVPPSLSL